MDLIFSDRYHMQVARTPTHIYLLPHPDLRPLVAHYTLCLPWPSPPGEPVRPQAAPLALLPDASGCLILTLLPEGPECRMYGPTTETAVVQNDLGFGPPRLFVEFKPGGLFSFTGLPQWELADRVWPLDDVSPALAELARTCCAQSPDLDGLVRAVDAALLAWRRQASPAGPMLDFLARGYALGADLAGYTGYSPRHLSRIFREGAGMGQKSFTRVLRVNRAAQRLKEGAASLTLLAQELGYFDQAHFIHDFKATCGVTPGAYRAGLSGFYNEPLKF